MRPSHDPSSSLLAVFGRFPKPADSLQADIYKEQHSLLLRQLLPMGVINIFAAFLIAVPMYPEFGLIRCLLWATPVVLIGVMQVMTWRRMRKRRAPTTVSGGFLRKSEYFALVSGVLWGSAAFVFRQTDDPLSTLFLHLVQAGMSAGVVSLLTPMPRHTLRFVLPCLLPIIPSIFFMQSIQVSQGAMLGVIMAIAMGRSSLDAYKQLAENVAKSWESRDARNTLVDAIESTNDAFSFYDKDGRLILANKRHTELFGSEQTSLPLEALNDRVDTIKLGNRWLMRSQHTTRLGGAVVVHTDVTTMKGRERELLAAQKEAVSADTAKSRFLSTMSHELRTPLNVILGFSRLMASDSQVQLTTADIAHYADSINESGTHLLRLIDDIIDYSKVGLDRFMVETQDVEIRALLVKAVSLAASFENVKDLSLIDVMVSPKIGQLRVDQSVCHRIVMNLLTNALRFSKQNCRVVIRIGLDAENRPFIAVRDFGVGIREDELERVFEAFYQSANASAGEYGGTGLGLTLCRHLARLHGGDVILKSRVDVGTTATFVLPTSAYIPREVALETPGMMTDAKSAA